MQVHVCVSVVPFYLKFKVSDLLKVPLLYGTSVEIEHVFELNFMTQDLLI